MNKTPLKKSFKILQLKYPASSQRALESAGVPGAIRVGKLNHFLCIVHLLCVNVSCRG